MKSTLPWILVLILIAGAGLIFTSNQRQAAELEQYHAAAEADKARSSGQDSARGTAESPEVVQLRKDHEELMRLRNEIRQLRDDNQKLTKDLDLARKASAAQQEQLQAGLAEVQQLKAQTSQAEKNNQLVACITNLRQIDAAKLQWSIENNRPQGSVAGPQDLAQYFPAKTFPSCPGGGAYSINPVGQNATCSVPGHSVPK